MFVVNDLKLIHSLKPN